MAKILLVDDEESMTKMLQAYLIKAGYEVAVCHDALEAERKVGEENPDLVVIDYQLPGKNGVELLAELRSRKDARALPVLFMSGTQSIFFANKIPPEPTVRFLTKPIDVDEFIGLIREMLNPDSWSSRPRSS